MPQLTIISPVLYVDGLFRIFSSLKHFKILYNHKVWSAVLLLCCNVEGETSPPFDDPILNCAAMAREKQVYLLMITCERRTEYK